MPDTPDDILIQRCVDGELDGAAETDLLQNLHQQDSVAGWRTLALAFLEERLFRTASLQHLDRILFPLELPTLSAAQPAVDSAPTRRSNWSLLSGMGLSTLLGIGLGFASMTWMQSQRLNDGSVATNPPGEVSLPSTAEANITSNAPTMTAHSVGGGVPVAEVDLAPLWLSDVPIRAPVVNGTDVPQHWLQRQPERIPANVRARLESQGYLVDEKRQFLVVPLENGQRMLVPHDAVRVRYAVQ